MLRLNRRARTLLGLAAAVVIASVSVGGLLKLEERGETAHAARQVLTRVEVHAARLHSWERRVLVGQSGLEELASIRRRAHEMTAEGEELQRLAPEEPMALRLIASLAAYRVAIDEQVERVAARDLDGARVVQRERAAPRFEAVEAALAPAQTAAHERGEQASDLLAAGSVATLLLALASTSFLFWAVGRARRTSERRSEARFRALVQNAADLVAIVDQKGLVRYASPASTTLLGVTPEAVLGASVVTLLHPEDELVARRAMQAAGLSPRINVVESLRVRHADSSWRHVEATWRNLLDEPGIGGIVVNMRDVSERKALEDELAYRAFHDSLTELPNRALVVDRLGQALARGARSGREAAVLFIDLDEFKVINDSLGHEAGDRLLVGVAQRLRASVRPGDTVARLGGDEFIVLLEDLFDDAEAVAAAERCLEQLATGVIVDGREVFVAASIGIAMSGAEGLPEDLLRRADVAMYAAKARGKANYVVFDAALESRPLERLELESDLRRALERDELRLHYQPIIDLDTGRVSGAEALVRWQHPERGLVLPGQFIQLAEETGLIVPIGRWVLNEACRQAQAWQARSPDQRPLVISVNVSGRQFQHVAFVEDVSKALRNTGLPADCLKLEITESVAMAGGTATIQTLQALKGLGVQLAIDDFGTGYSSLSYLKRFPIDTLKIDRAFVDGLGQDAQDTAIVRSVITIARSLDISVTAEGIETMDQLNELRALACDQGQGFYFARPEPVDNLARAWGQGEIGPPDAPRRAA